jgi:hypothetical protein
MTPVWRGALLVLVIAACGGDAGRDQASIDTSGSATAADVDTAAPDERVARARSAADGLGRELMPRLIAALDSGGPEHAVSFCADSAQAWTARQAGEGVYIRRVSLRVRNPANRPDSSERRHLERLDSLHRTGSLPGEVVLTTVAEDGESVVEYMRPILVQERCLACHGGRDQISADVRELIAARYPTDEATGYAAGDLRGMISVRVRD